ncbi:Spy/CpxP family protein refolding chaperone [Nitrincola sp.]|uniref:Spy/CpxP family protein refolding chaperone n=1 Tax=Nitrincola sp. TaxID=1926584 RepID=UPI003A8F224A
MKTTKLAQLGILTLGLAIGTMALAQKGPGPGDREPPMQRFAETLNLSEEQRSQMEALWEENREEREAQREAMQAKHAEMRERLSAILTPEQLEQMDEMRGKNPQGFRGDRRGGCDMEGRPDRGERREMRQEQRQEQRQNSNS